MIGNANTDWVFNVILGIILVMQSISITSYIIKENNGKVNRATPVLILLQVKSRKKSALNISLE